MKSSTSAIRPLCLLVVLGVCVAFIAYHVYVGSFQLAALSGDQLNIGIMVLKQSRPELFARDYAFKDMSLFRFYTPLWRWLVEQIMSITGDYAGSLLVLMPVMMFVYLAGMFVLAYYTTESVLVATLVSSISSLQWRGFPGDMWGVAGLQTVVTPRGLFCMLAPWLFFLMFRWFRQRDRWWQLPLLAFLGGLGANLHPPSGMIFTQLLLSMILLTQGINKKSLTNLLLSALAAVAGAMPMLFNFIRHTGEELGAVPFEVFYQVMHERLGNLFPFRSPVFFGHPLNARGQELMVWAYLGGMLLWGCIYLLYRRGRLPSLSPNVVYGFLFILQAPAAYLLTGFEATALVAVTIFYWAYRILRSEPDRLDRWLLYLIMLIFCYSFVAGYVLEHIWKHFELWSLTSLVGEQTRAARFIYLPLFLYAARFMQIAVRLGWKGSFLAVAAACLTAGAPPQDLFWSVGVGLLVLGWPEKNMLRDHQWIEPILEAATLGVTLKAVLALASVEGSSWLALYIAFAYGVLALGVRYRALRWRLLIGTSSLILACVVLESTGIYSFPILLPLRSLALTPSHLWTQNSPNHLKQAYFERRNRNELYDWARAHTDIDSLFYHNSLEFRFRAQRSITHCWKDLGAAYYQGGRMVEFYNRHNELERARQEVSLLLAQAEKYEVDYIVTPSSQAQSILPIAFSNSTYTVYRYNPTMGAINLHLVRGEWEAIVKYEKALELAPDDTWAYFALGQVHWVRGEIEQAEAAYLDAINADWYNVSARMSLARVYVAQGRMDEAIWQYEEAIRLRSDYLAPHEGLGDIYLMQGRVDEAVVEYEKAIGFPTGTSDHHLALGDLYSFRNMTDRAIAEYRRASIFDLFSGSVYDKLGDIYRMEGEFEKAIAAYKQSIAMSPGQVRPYMRIGFVYEALGKWEEALNWYRKASRVDPGYAGSLVSIGDLYMAQDNLEEAMSAYREAIEVAPDYLKGYVSLGQAYEAQGEMRRAIELFQQAAEVNPQSAYPYLALGGFYLREGELEKAVMAYQQAIAVEPGDVNGYMKVGYLYQREGDLEKAVMAYQQAIAVDPGNVSGYMRLGRVYEGHGEIDKATTAYQQAIIAEPIMAEPHRQLALLYEQAGLLEQVSREQAIFIALTSNGEQ